jgi:WD40 repeat protein
VLRGHTATVNRVAFDDEGRTIATTAEDGTARVWDGVAPDDASVLRGHASYVYPVAYSPDGETLVSGSGDATVRLWDAFPVARRFQARRAMLNQASPAR